VLTSRRVCYIIVYLKHPNWVTVVGLLYGYYRRQANWATDDWATTICDVLRISVLLYLKCVQISSDFIMNSVNFMMYEFILY